MDQNKELYEMSVHDASIETPLQETKTDQCKKSNKCNQCEYATSHTGNLKMHLKIHSGEKSLKCNLCKYSSSHAGHLRIHLKIHSGEKSIKCNQCDFACSDPSALRTHLKTHSGEKPFFLISLEAHQTYSVNLKTIGGQDYRDLDTQ